jgi:hypothetical protein
MKLTNKFSLPQALVNAVTYDKYTGGDTFSYSSLSEPPQITQLTLRHDDEITADVVDRIWLLMGSAIHGYLQYHAGANEIAEKRLFAELDGHRISGQQDLLVDGIIHDWKTSSAWSAVFNPEGKIEWETQLNMYRWLAQKNGYEIKGLQVNSILRDWVVRKGNEQDSNYPKIPVQIYKIEMWPLEKTEAYMRERIKLHIAAKELPDDKLPECTDDETWAKPGKVALMKNDNKRALQLFPTLEAANNAKAVLERTTKDKYRTENRVGTYPRCDNYCPVAQWCWQLKRRNQNMDDPMLWPQESSVGPNKYEKPE